MFTWTDPNCPEFIFAAQLLAVLSDTEGDINIYLASNKGNIQHSFLSCTEYFLIPLLCVQDSWI